MSTEHKILAAFIKSVHKNLRDETKMLGTELAWKNHCNDIKKLRKYANAMQDLAVKHWDHNAQCNDKVFSRVMWVHQRCIEYFCSLEKYWEKEVKILNRLGLKALQAQASYIVGKKLKLLDVGSCYTPFSNFEEFEVTAIDIAPANTEVLTCDFLNLNIASLTSIENGTLLSLEESSFAIVVFSLLLEYLPSPEQRLKSCLNAYNLLKDEGILAIVTPDSNHIGSNIKIFKSWQYVLAKHGFVRVKYEKLPHLHCILFRKTPFPEVARRWADLNKHKDFYEEIFIPQDFTKEGVSDQHRFDEKEQWSENTFLQHLDLDI